METIEFERVAAEQGWNDQSRIDVLLRYIESQASFAAFADFLATQAAFENEDEL